MYWSRVTALFGPDSFNDNDTFPSWNNKVNYTVSDTLLSNRQTMHPYWTLYAVLGVQPVLISVIFTASFVLGYFSAINGSNFGIIAVLAGVRTETLKLFEGTSFSGTLEKPLGLRIDTLTTTGREKEPWIEYSFYDDGGPPKPSRTAPLRDRFVPSRFDVRGNTVENSGLDMKDGLVDSPNAPLEQAYLSYKRVANPTSPNSNMRPKFQQIPDINKLSCRPRSSRFPGMFGGHLEWEDASYGVCVCVCPASSTLAVARKP